MSWMTMTLAVGIIATALGLEQKSAESLGKPGQVIREGGFPLNTSADKALEFFTPEGERAWVAGWNPKPVYPAESDVAFRQNAVFRVDHNGERSLWTIIEANAREHVAEYVYVVEGERLSRVRVDIESLGDKRCRVHVRYVYTAISTKGAQFLATVTDEGYVRKMRDWQRSVSALIR